MAASTDFSLLNNDIVIKNGDFATGPSDMQHIEDTINAFPGWWKEYPADGVGILQYINSSGQEQAITRSVAINLRADGYRVTGPSISVNNKGTLTIIPNATKI